MEEKGTPEMVTIVLDALVGSTFANADTAMDNISLSNVPKFAAVCDWVLDRLANAQQYVDSPYASAKQVANRVMHSAGDLALAFEKGFQ